MQLTSTNNPAVRVDFKTAVMYGLADDGGLYLSTQLPRLPAAWLEVLSQLTPVEIATTVAQHLLGEDLPTAVLQQIVAETVNFPIPVKPLTDDTGMVELFHGPTLAFKDVGARFMARIMGYYVAQEQRPLTVVVATSGDTGSAVAHGFYKVPGIRVIILYPAGRISHGQEQQLATLGENIQAYAVAGSFDDCQQLVKQALADQTLRQQQWLTSANSINIARLIPQMFYYFIARSQVQTDLPVVVSVPSGNFGNLTAGVMAQRLGLPIDHWVAATNINDIVPTYLKLGKFLPRASVQTLANAMDVGNPSNFARLQALYDHDVNRMRQTITGTVTTNAQIEAIIQTVATHYQYILDPHGAVAYHGLQQYRTHHPKNYGLCLATAHPAKFIEIVEPLIQHALTLPSALADCLPRPNLAQPLDNNYLALRDIIAQP